MFNFIDIVELTRIVGLLEVEAKSTAEPADLVERRLEVGRLEQKLLHGHQVVEAGGGGLLLLHRITSNVFTRTLLVNKRVVNKRSL